MNDRKFFTGGIIYLNLKHHKSFHSFEKQLKHVIQKSLNLPDGELRKKIEEAKDESFLDLVVKYFK